ncbi:glycosyltransferase family 2 protein [Massilia sp. W12]|uniref:glycosyltransferase family 2 protein n=1 Tax=Massilia sp. W12 TaxID=3126507 RepID=UPI0030D3F3D1
MSAWRGDIEACADGLLYGWAVNCAQPQQRVTLEVLLDGELVQILLADCHHPGLPDCGQADECHGFVLDLSRFMQSSGDLQLRVANGGPMLGRPWPLKQVQAAQSGWRQLVFSDGGLRLLGWARDPHYPDRIVQVQAWQGQRLLAQGKADSWHPAMRGLKLGHHGFVLDLPASLADGGLHRVRVQTADGEELPGSPLDVCLYAPPPQGEQSMQALLQQYQRYAPHSLGWPAYADWRSDWDWGARSDLLPAAAPAAIVVVLYGPAQADWQSSLHSLAQSGVTCIIWRLDEEGWRRLSPEPQKLRAKHAAKPDLLQDLAQAQAMLCLRAGDSLRPAACLQLWQALCLSQADAVYADSEHAQGADWQAWLKPAWNLDYALASDMALEGLMCRAALALAQAGKLEKLADWTALPAWSWRCLAAAQDNIAHWPHVLYRMQRPLPREERIARAGAAQAILQQHTPGARLRSLQQIAALAPDSVLPPRRIVESDGDWYAMRSLHWPKVAAAELISIIIPTRDALSLLQSCLDSLRQYANQAPYEILIADNDSREPETLQAFAAWRKQGVRIISCPGAFNFSRINNQAAAAARGDSLLFLNNDVQALHPGWLDAMQQRLRLPGVAAVGAKLLWPNGMVQHGGVLLGVADVAGHYGNCWHETEPGAFGRNQLDCRVSCVTAACMLVRRSAFEALGGFDEQAFPVAFNDVDLCLRLRQQGGAVLWTAQACLLHAESATRGHEDSMQKKARARREIYALRQRWGAALQSDPAYHPALNLEAQAPSFSGLALPPRARLLRPALDAWPARLTYDLKET